MKRHILSLGIIGVVGLLATGCLIGPTIRGNGEIRSESRDVSGFEAISISGSGKAIITQGDREGLEIRADENLLPYLVTEVRGGELRIGWRGNLRFTEAPVFRIEVRALERLELSGSLTAEVDRLETGRLEAGISGSGAVRVGTLEAEEVRVQVSGSGAVRIGEGRAGSLRIGVSGSGDTQASGFKVEQADVSISGSGSARLWVTEQLKVQVSGSGSVHYRGSPQISSSISGSGRIRQESESGG